MTAVPAPGSRCPRVVIVDGDRRVRQSLADVLSVGGDLEIVGTAGEVRAALELIDAHHPDVLVVDPRLPDVDAGEAMLHAARLASPATEVVLMGWSDECDRPSLARMARGFVAKSGPPDAFVQAILSSCGC